MRLTPRAREVERDAQMQMDSEPKYFIGANASFCGQPDIAFRLIKRAIEQGYCAYEALQSDPSGEAATDTSI